MITETVSVVVPDILNTLCKCYIRVNFGMTTPIRLHRLGGCFDETDASQVQNKQRSTTASDQTSAGEATKRDSS